MGGAREAFSRALRRELAAGLELAALRLWHVAAYTLHFAGTERVEGPNFTADRATITVTRDGAPIATLYPERRFFALQQMTTSVTAIRTTLLADLYVALGDPDEQGGSTIRAYWKPLVPWIWIGAVIMAAGGGLSLMDRRWRVGVAARRRLPDAHPAPGE
jgi:cytochrome c-type biogenesis protein CcmF